MHEEIGNAAGKIWKYLGTVEQASPTKIATATGLKQTELHRGIGWLAREGKLAIEKEGRTELFSLVEGD